MEVHRSCKHLREVTIITVAAALRLYLALFKLLKAWAETFDLIQSIIEIFIWEPVNLQIWFRLFLGNCRNIKRKEKPCVLSNNFAI